MIVGSVNSRGAATISLEIRGTTGGSVQVEAIIDTGFNGFLTLPSSVHAALRTPVLGDLELTLADGSVRRVEYHEATVVWDGQLRNIESEVVDTVPLVGTAMLHRHELHAVFEPGGPVTIQALP